MPWSVHYFEKYIFHQSSHLVDEKHDRERRKIVYVSVCMCKNISVVCIHSSECTSFLCCPSNGEFQQKNTKSRDHKMNKTLYLLDLKEEIASHTHADKNTLKHHLWNQWTGISLTVLVNREHISAVSQSFSSSKSSNH